MRLFILSSLAAMFALTASILHQAPASAQTQAPCTPANLLKGEKKHTGTPCTPPQPAAKADAGKGAPCGPVAYSNADQTYVSRPCTD